MFLFFILLLLNQARNNNAEKYSAVGLVWASRPSFEIGVAFYRLFAHCAGDFDGVFGGVPVRIPDEFRTLVLGGYYRAFAVAFNAYRLAIQIRPNRVRRLVYNRAMRKRRRIRVAKPSGGARRDRISRNNPLARIPQKTYLAVLQSYPHVKDSACQKIGK